MESKVSLNDTRLLQEETMNKLKNHTDQQRQHGTQSKAT